MNEIIRHNPAYEVRVSAPEGTAVLHARPELGEPEHIPTGVTGVVDPFSVYPGDDRVSVVFDKPHRPRYGRGALHVKAADLEWVNPAQAANVYRRPEGAEWKQPIA